MTDHKMNTVTENSKYSHALNRVNESWNKNDVCSVLGDSQKTPEQPHTKSYAIDGGQKNEIRDTAVEYNQWQDQNQPPDGGWGWLVVAGGFIIVVSLERIWQESMCIKT